MKASEYRAQFDAELRRTTRRRATASRSIAPESSTDDLLAELNNRRFGAKRRIEALEGAAAIAVKRPQLMESLIAIVAEPGEDKEVRVAALSVIEASSFKTVEFRRYTPDYTEALRVAATDDDADVRAAALDILALRKDPYAQQLLVDGLRNPREALVKPVHAVRMLGYDMHADHYPLLREIVATSKQPPLRRAALRVLAADSESRPLMRSIATDKTEDKQARTTAVLALQSLSPSDFASAAQAVVLDDDDDSDVRATVINAMAHGSTRPSRDIARKVREIDASPGGTVQLNRAARAFTAAQPAQPSQSES